MFVHQFLLLCGLEVAPTLHPTRSLGPCSQPIPNIWSVWVGSHAIHGVSGLFPSPHLSTPRPSCIGRVRCEHITEQHIASKGVSSLGVAMASFGTWKIQHHPFSALTRNSRTCRVPADGEFYDLECWVGVDRGVRMTSITQRFNQRYLPSGDARRCRS